MKLTILLSLLLTLLVTSVAQANSSLLLGFCKKASNLTIIPVSQINNSSVREYPFSETASLLNSITFHNNYSTQRTVIPIEVVIDNMNPTVDCTIEINGSEAQNVELKYTSTLSQNLDAQDYSYQKIFSENSSQNNEITIEFYCGYARVEKAQDYLAKALLEFRKRGFYFDCLGTPTDTEIVN